MTIYFSEPLQCYSGLFHALALLELLLGLCWCHLWGKKVLPWATQCCKVEGQEYQNYGTENVFPCLFSGCPMLVGSPLHLYWCLKRKKSPNCAAFCQVTQALYRSLPLCGGRRILEPGSSSATYCTAKRHFGT